MTLPKTFLMKMIFKINMAIKFINNNTKMLNILKTVIWEVSIFLRIRTIKTSVLLKISTQNL